MSPLHLRRLKLLMVLGILFYGIILARLVSIQVFGHAKLDHEARGQQTSRVILEPERGRIYDRRLLPLADNVDVSQISVRPAEVRNASAAREFIREAAGLRGLDRLRRGRRNAYIRISSQTSPEQEVALRKSVLPAGVQVEEVPARVYPLDDLARPVVGVVGVDGTGLEGIERVFDRELRGVGGWATLFRDGRGLEHQLPQSMVKLPEPGLNLITTIDRDAQSVLVMELKRAVERTGARSGTAIFADPHTGDIFAMATVDGKNPPSGSPGRNRVIADQYEPGSTFKLLVGCAALEERILTPEDSFYVNHGELDMGGFTMHDAHPETRWYSVRTATALSSNVCYAQIGTKVGASILYRYARLFGFGQPTRIQLPGETSGQIRNPSRWSARSLATISIGQEVTATPLQILMAYCAVANGGILMRPRIATALVNDTGTPARLYPVERVRRVISPETAETYRSFLRDAVTMGTAKEAALPWCEVAGKTGTAQKSDEAGRGYGQGRYMSSFVGMVPAQNPQIVGLIVLDEPRGAYYGGTVAAPVFRDIIATWATLGRGPIRIPAQTLLTAAPRRSSGVRVPDVRMMAAEQARVVLRSAGMSCAPEGNGARVAVQSPEAGTSVRSGEVVRVVLTTGPPPDTGFPDVRGLSVREAVARLSALSVHVSAVLGSGQVVEQNPQPGSAIRVGQACALRCAPRSL
ncbi:MAG TPA: penicillin-binding transpeptidase domain-containing protein [Candidatus Limnocylindrales bacterium]|nr:penicillin-binding transpeptidase domain-containing protein [Candidatus Limnocylindrales bacterium]